MTRIAAVLVPLLAVGWLLVIWFAPFFTPPVAGLVYAFSSLICHQLPERSFHVAAMQLPVCARCTGIYTGGALAAVAWMAWGRSKWPDALRRSGETLRWSLIAGLPTAFTLAAEWLDFWRPSNSVRALGGIPLGGVLVLILVSALAARRDMPVTARIHT